MYQQLSRIDGWLILGLFAQFMFFSQVFQAVDSLGKGKTQRYPRKFLVC